MAIDGSRRRGENSGQEDLTELSTQTAKSRTAKKRTTWEETSRTDAELCGGEAMAVPGALPFSKKAPVSAAQGEGGEREFKRSRYRK